MIELTNYEACVRRRKIKTLEKMTLSEFEVYSKVAKPLYNKEGGGRQSRGLKLRDGSVYTFPILTVSCT